MGLKGQGSRQEKVMLWVAKHPRSHAKEIQEGIKYAQYGNINIDVKKLTDYKLLTYIKEPSSEKRKRVVNKYFCTADGLIYSLSKSKDSDIIKIIEANYGIVKEFDFFYEEYKRMGKEDFILWLRNYLLFVPMLKDHTFEEIMSNMLVYFADKFENVDEGERLKIINSAVKNFPNAGMAVDNLLSFLSKVDRKKKND